MTELKMHASFTATLLVLVVGCEAAQPQQTDAARASTEDSTHPVEAPNASSANWANKETANLQARRPASAVREQRQAHYRTTIAKMADGTEFSRGSAQLEIRYNAQHPHATLALRALGPSDALSVTLPLDVAALAARDLDLAIVGSGILRRARGSSDLEKVAPKRIHLERSQEAGKRARFYGKVLDPRDTVSVDFETELAVSCLVPPEMLGVAANGHAQGPGISLLVVDEEFESPFCAQFAGLL